MWTTPKPTLGGAGMWDEVRSNGIVQLQHYKPDGTVLAGTLPLFSVLYLVFPIYSHFNLCVAVQYTLFTLNSLHWMSLEPNFDVRC